MIRRRSLEMKQVWKILLIVVSAKALQKLCCSRKTWKNKSIHFAEFSFNCYISFSAYSRSLLRIMACLIILTAAEVNFNF
ncbi:hypothetical protein GDO78_005219 [Eleutherodactylus coqui]|uniref:Secreted protein n=1 Tax=Eleutherodactylus coqui TaxID=57060 RepID=A0A8J6KCP9_ELECQ|nr:hypothetical protein GDO78_005219 [Eleutherodactylus coqui]